MKGANSVTGRAGGSLQRGVHSLVEFVQEYVVNNGTYPKIKDMPVIQRTIEYYFGSFSELLREARLGTEQLARRRSKKKRYCRYCKKLLPDTNWFFCPYTDCADNFSEEYDSEFEKQGGKEFQRERGSLPLFHFTNGEPLGPTKVISKCRGCREKCKVKIAKDHDEAKMSVQCKKDFGLVIQE